MDTSPEGTTFHLFLPLVATEPALPDLRGRTALGAGNGIGLTPRLLGQSGGQESVTLSMAEMPSHQHEHTTDYAFELQAAPENGTNTAPSNGDVLASSYHSGTDSSIKWYAQSSSNLVALDGVQAVSNTIVQDSGRSLGHENMQPWLAMNYIIAIQGSYPPHS